MKKHTAHSLTLKHKKVHPHKKHKSASQFVKNRKEEEMEQMGKKKHAKKMACKTCGSLAHAMHSATATKRTTKKKAAVMQNARYERMRKRVFGIK